MPESSGRLSCSPHWWILGLPSQPYNHVSQFLAINSLVPVSHCQASLVAQIRNLPANAGGLGSIPGSGKSPGEGNGYSLQYSCLENPHRQRSLLGYSLWGHKESDTTEKLSTAEHKELKDIQWYSNKETKIRGIFVFMLNRFLYAKLISVEPFG